LKVEFTPWGSNETKKATYRPFFVGPAPRYRLSVGKARLLSPHMVDALRYSSGAAFSARDKDQDQWSGNCSKRRKKYGGVPKRTNIRFGSSGWWFKSCFWSNLNGMNAATGLRRGSGIQWGRTKASSTTMSFRKVAA